ncbi:VWA domain-containing protein [Spongiibacter sp.]|uniref:VWA domain-containing protein n=1 Tax=Spongiibacter sp. TaxID=2024860 RepID=UPI0035677705
MDATLLQFIRHLRHAGLSISTAETLDAMQVATSLGYADRRLLETGLASCLAKSADERVIFHDCFSQFFDLAAPDQTADDSAADNASDSQESQQDGALPGQGGSGEGQGSGGGSGMSSDALRAELMRAAAEVGLDAMQYQTQRGIYRRRILDALGDSQRRDAIATLAAGNPQEQRQAQWLARLRDQQIDMLGELLDRQLLLNNNAGTREFQQALMRNSQLSSLDSYYRDQLPPLIRKLAKKLAAKHRQRYRRAKRGRLDLGKTLRRNIAHGGVPFHRYWRNSRQEKSDIYILCDLSGSVSNWSQLLMLFVQALADVLPNTRSFVFCGQSVEVSELFRQHPAEEALAIIQQRHGMGSSDYGRALNSFRQQVEDRINRRSTILILGDGRGNGGDTGIAALRELYHRARLVLWFNPESRSRWNTGDSEIRRYQTACHYVAECGSLRKLERLLDELLSLIH